ncbi:MAG: hypothetical protein ACUVYA_11290, partial [Planctomycetota bacterium]
ASNFFAISRTRALSASTASSTISSSAGLLALQVCGHYGDPTVKGAANWLLENGPRWYQDWFFCGTYYYAQGMFQRGGLHAAEARKKVEEILLRVQEKGGDHAGSWRAPHGQEQGAGRVYSTALAVLSLPVKYHTCRSTRGEAPGEPRRLPRSPGRARRGTSSGAGRGEADESDASGPGPEHGPDGGFSLTPTPSPRTIKTLRGEGPTPRMHGAVSTRSD